MFLFSEPSMRWYRIKDDSNDFTMVKVPIEVCHSTRKSVKSVKSENTQPSVKNVNLKDTGDVTSGSADEISNIAELSWGVPLLHNKKSLMNNAKAGNHEKQRIQKQDVISEVKSFTHKTKLKDTDISQLLDVDDYNDNDYCNNASFILDKVTDKCSKPPSYQNSPVQNTRSSSVLNARHSEDKVAKLSKSQPCTSKSKHDHASAKKKLYYEYGETKQEVSFGECRSRCNVTDTSLAFEGERIKGLETVRNERAELHRSKQGCTSKHINYLEYIQKSEVTDCTVVSVKNSETTDRHEDLLRRVSIVIKITFTIQFQQLHDE
jgi:hypothetical protein